MNDPCSLLITEKAAKKYFGEDNPLGKTITAGKDNIYTVTGVLQNIPQNSHFRFDFLASFNTLDNILNWPNWRTSWGANFLKTYIVIRNETDLHEIEKKLQLYTYDFRGKETSFHIQPMTDIHLHGKCDVGELEINSDIKYIYIFSAIAVFLILIACFNYMNLTTAKYTSRINEIGIRKVTGANRGQLIRQFLTESFSFTFIAIVFSLILVYIMLPYFGHLLNRNLSYSILSKEKVIFLLIGITLITGSISGIYPALFLSSFQPVNILKGAFNVRSKGAVFFRNSLVIFQFTISITLIIATLIAYSQLRYMQNRKLGYDKEHIISISLKDPDLSTKIDVLKTELLNHPEIVSVSVSTGIPSNISWIDRPAWEGINADEIHTFRKLAVDNNFLKLYNIKNFRENI